MDKPRVVVRDTAKPDAPADQPKPAAEAIPPKATRSPPPADASKNSMAEPGPVAGTQYVAPKLASFGSIDKHALAAPPDAEESIPSLTAYLIQPAKNDLEKMRAIYRWITDRIAYDVDDFFNGRPGIADPEVVLKKRLAVCEGYSRLFKAMCDDAHVEAVVVSGYGKSLGYEPGKEKLNDFKHAWNAAKLGGAWYLLDVTWAAGHVKERKFVKKLNELHFLTRPDQFIFRHFPRDPRWQLVSNSMNLEQWEALPMVDDTLFAAGVSSQDIMKTAQRKTFRGLVKSYHAYGLAYTIRQAPLDSHLEAGSTLSVRIEAPQFLKMAIVNEGQWHYLTKKAGVFTGSAKVLQGTAKVSALLPGKGESYWGILEYVVEEKSTAAHSAFKTGHSFRFSLNEYLP